MRLLASALLLGLVLAPAALAGEKPTRVFVFAGQSNMEGADSRVADIERFPLFRGLGEPQEDVLFRYAIGREDKARSVGWEPLAPVRGMVGPELSFAREVSRRTDGPIAIIKVAAGGTHLGGDWNPDEPSGFEMYPLLLETVRGGLAELDQRKVDWQLEALVWHQGENDMFVDEYREGYGANLANFIGRVRQDLEAPELPVFVGELCTKTIWGMDLRPRMDAIARGQKQATAADPLAWYVPTAHIGVEIGNPVGLHYHYGTLGQLEHGLNHAEAYLASIGQPRAERPGLERWPHRRGSPVELFVLAGHRNMEGERAFVQELRELPGGKRLARPDPGVPFRYSIGGGVHTSSDWEPLAPAGLYDDFGPELSFAATLSRELDGQIALAKFTHGGSQIIDWTPEGSMATDRHLFPAFLSFIRSSVAELEERGHEVRIGGIVYHVGENDMSFYPYRKEAAARIRSMVQASREQLDLPDLRWFLSQQPPTDHESVNGIDVVGEMAAIDLPGVHHVIHQDLPAQEERLVIDTAGIVWLGERLAEAVLRVRGE